MIKICLIHGPNINLLGMREANIYGTMTFDEVNRSIKEHAKSKGIEIRIFQSNHEGEIVDNIHEAREWADAIIINPGAYTHYSYSIRDAITGVRLPAIEVHISNVHAREEFRRNSVISPIVVGQIVGMGTYGYLLAVDAIKHIVEQSHQ